MRKLMFVAVGILPASAFAFGGGASMTQTSAGIGGIQSAISDGRFADASRSLGGLFENGGGGFSANQEGGVVDARGVSSAHENQLDFRGEIRVRETDVPAPSIGGDADPVGESPLASASSIASALGFVAATMLAYRQKSGEGGGPSHDGKEPKAEPKPTKEPKPAPKDVPQSTLDVSTNIYKGDLPQDTGD